MDVKPSIIIRGASQNNLKSVSLDLPLNELIVITGVSGSGKSSLAFDTIYAEGQRRYVETFSPYARQFLERMDKPRVERIEGIPPAIAIDQTNTVRTSRSTVGTMTELNDHLKLLYARAAQLYCEGCGAPVRRDNPATIYAALLEGHRNGFAPGGRMLMTFRVETPANFSSTEVRALLEAQGYTRFLAEDARGLEVIQDRITLPGADRARVVEGLEAALRHGAGGVRLHALGADGAVVATLRFSADLHCPDCDQHYQETSPNTFSFNSPIGACPECRGFGRTIGIDPDLVVPDSSLTLRGGAIRPWESASYRECRDDLLRFAALRKIPVDTAWNGLTEAQRRWVMEGEGPWEDGVWYGVGRFFDWLETKSYRMHIRVLLSKYRSYSVCRVCRGARLKSEALLWRLGSPGLNLHALTLLSLEALLAFFRKLRLPAPLDEAAQILLGEIIGRLEFLVDVGLGYLTLDRQSRTLSGGEVQRINLTTALGASLVNTLFVLDEPSIGLHPRDISRLIGILRKLRDAGNTLLVVEHDPDVIRAADRVIDMGPGPGAAGGDVVYEGDLAGLTACRASLTGDYLADRRSVLRESSEGEEGDAGGGAVGACIEICGAREHNLKDVDVTIPLGGIVGIAGVSGSGKSTLVESILYRGILRQQQKPTEAPGAHRALRGVEGIAEVLFVDQSPIGRTTRSNPASYVGVLDAIRKRFAALSESRARGYTAGTFSFNAGDGRCPTCMGNGFEHVEMQFLSDVYIRCPDCNGTRYRADVLEVWLPPACAVVGGKPAEGERWTDAGLSIAGVLDLTVGEASLFFEGCSDVLRPLEPLVAVGLGYLKLGQPVPTLSGGEAQRLKLAGHLAQSSAGGRTRRRASFRPARGKLFLFDEPTTGLHFYDVAVLMRALRRLVANGHSVVVIEHNLDVLRCADWIIDLGPEGGDAGGQVVCQGPPAAVMACAASHTGRAMGAARPRHTGKTVKAGKGGRVGADSGQGGVGGGRGRVRAGQAIEILHAREHNLRNVSLTIPRDCLTVITGISGSGKSTVAFDILFGEGQRRYLESLNAYARQFVQPAARPDVDAISGIPPTVAIEQRTSRGGRKSTVATVTEIYHFLRLLYVKLGVQHCPDCALPIEPQSRDRILEQILSAHRGQRVTLLAPLVTARKGYYTDLAKWAAQKGFSHLRVDGKLLPTDAWPRLDRFKEHDLALPVGTCSAGAKSRGELGALLDQALVFGKGVVQVLTADGDEPAIFSIKRACPGCGRSFPELDPRLFSYNSKHGWCPRCYGVGSLLTGFDGEQTGEEYWWNAGWAGEERVCPACEGQRLRPEALAVRYRERPIAAMVALTVHEAQEYFQKLSLRKREAEIARDLVAELTGRLHFLEEVGLSYLTLDRAAPTLSGGEARRIRLASQLGSNLRGVCYILDEPTIGLHARDNAMLLATLETLRRKGNTVVVVEHDEDTIRRAEHIIDLGPGAGREGGEVVVTGTLADVMRHPRSVTGLCLREPPRERMLAARALEGVRERPGGGALIVRSASLHNLKQVDVTIPLGRLVCVTGVSGSGKSTLVRDIVHDNLKALLQANGKLRPGARPHGCGGLELNGAIRRVLEVDQTPIGKTPRSCPATYVGIWDSIRRLFADTQDARLRGYSASRFSFNVSGGRCEVCEGQGVQRIEMHFLPDVTMPCEACGGARFNAETLGILYKGSRIGDVLRMSVSEAAAFFAAHAAVHYALKLLEDVGLGYLTLGQQSPTLSGGEAQRIKLVTELAKARSGGGRRLEGAPATLYVLDEPTVGLHMGDVEKLLRVLRRLVEDGHSVLVIEHNLDVVAASDWIIDLGPDGGDGGGRVVASGVLEDLIGAAERSATGAYLRSLLGAKRPRRGVRALRS